MCRPDGWVFGPKFSKQGSHFQQILINMSGFSRNWQKIAKNGPFSPKFIIKVGMTASFGN